MKQKADHHQTSPNPAGATAVISHKIRDGSSSAYEAWLDEVRPKCQAASGHLDWHLVRPVSGVSTTYTVIIRFDTEDNLRQWMNSPDRRDQIERIRPLLDQDDDYAIRSGLDFWFMPTNTGVKVPVKWKQFLITWSAIYPLSLGVPFLVSPAFRELGLQGDRIVSGFLASGIIVWLMTYVIMPRYSRLVRKWLFA